MGLAAVVLAGCVVTVRGETTAIGGGPVQATAQASQRYIATVQAHATVTAAMFVTADGEVHSCTCDDNH